MLQWDRLLRPVRSRPSSREVEMDLRNPFEKDYHRILQSASFRRLQDKTQVFPLDQSDFVRTRLTHSLEVSSLAKSLGQQVCRRLTDARVEGRPSPEQAVEICDLLLCAGLIHDIGNPPFGHYGETTIRRWFELHLPRLQFRGQPLTHLLVAQMREDFLHFEGNAQALRVLSKLHFLVDEYGMNLTLPLLHTIMKYPVPSTQVDASHPQLSYHKLGYFYAERELFRTMTEEMGTLRSNQEGPGLWVNETNQWALLESLAVRSACRHPLTYLLEAADDIAYCTADMEDAFKKNKLSFDQFLRALKTYPKRMGYPEEKLVLYRQLLDLLQEKKKFAMKKNYPEPENYAVQNWVVRAQAALLEEVARQFVAHYREVMEGTYPYDIYQGSQAEAVLGVLSQIAYDFVFHSRQILRMEVAADSILGGLLDLFVPACIDFDTEKSLDPVHARLMDIISENYRLCYRRESRGKSEEEKLYLRLLLVTDYLSGMTDGYAKNLYQQLKGVDG